MNHRTTLNAIIVAVAITGFMTPKQKRTLKELDGIASHAQEAAEGEQWEKITLFREEIRSMIARDEMELAELELA